MSPFNTSSVTTDLIVKDWTLVPIPFTLFTPSGGNTTLSVPAIYIQAFPSARVFGASSISISDLRRNIDLYADFVEYVHRTVAGKPILHGYRDAMAFNQIICYLRQDKVMRCDGKQYTNKDKEERKEIKKAIRAWKKGLRQHRPRRFGFF